MNEVNLDKILSMNNKQIEDIEELEREDIKNEKDDTIKKIKEVLFELNQYLKYDRGHAFFLNYEDNTVYIVMTGGCAGCEHQDITIQDGILVALKEVVPEIKEVINVPLPLGF